MNDWFQATPEFLRLLAEERLKLAEIEAKHEKRYRCRHCGTWLEYDYGLPRALNRVRAWTWQQTHRLNCNA